MKIAKSKALKAQKMGLRALIILAIMLILFILSTLLPCNRFRKIGSIGKIYYSEREFTSLENSGPMWKDPLRADIFDLGKGVKLSMSETCFADSSGRTLPLDTGILLLDIKPNITRLPVNSSGIKNLVAFTKAMGYIRFFHPSDQVAKADWNHIAVSGVNAIEGATTPKNLADRLQQFFSPLAPTVHFLVSGEDSPQLKRPPGAVKIVRWRHHGFEPLEISLSQNQSQLLAFDRGVRLADVAILWTIIQHFYPYIDTIKYDWASALPKFLQKAAMDPDRVTFTRTLREFIALLHDGHANVSFEGEKPPRMPLLKIQLFENRAFVKAGPPDIHLGSELLHVNGERTADRLDRIRTETAASTVSFMTFKTAFKLLQVESGQSLRLHLVGPDGRHFQKDISVRERPEIMYHLWSPSKICELRPGIWYVDINRITGEEFKTVVPNLALAKGVIFDLREYPNVDIEFIQHLLRSPATSARWNVPIISQPDGQQWEWDTSSIWTVAPLKPTISGKVAFLAGGGTFSFGETCLGIVEAYHLGPIIGTTTAGTNGDITSSFLPGGFAVSWTGMRVLKQDGSPHQGIGIPPTYPVFPTIEGIAAGRDEVLEKGLEVVSGH